MSMKEENKYMFQYAYDNGFHSSGISFSSTKIVEDTGLITEKEANDLWDKYYPEVIKNLNREERPQMCIWKDCDSPTSYHTVEKEIDWRDDLEIKNGRVYKKELSEII